jgi:hypothetical protein
MRREKPQRHAIQALMIFIMDTGPLVAAFRKTSDGDSFTAWASSMVYRLWSGNLSDRTAQPVRTDACTDGLKLKIHR